ncbi:MAG: alpha-1,4-glucan--maltose-1-phosphate maltosyltransferase [Acidiferrobacteraceae bacterium]
MQPSDPRRTIRQGDRRRVVIENVQPAVDNGRFAIRRAEGESVTVEADVFADGHDEISCRLLHRHETELHWREEDMTALGNDRWRGTFTVSLLGRHYYTVSAGIDSFLTWRRDLQRRHEAGEDLGDALKEGALQLLATARRAGPSDAMRLRAAGMLLQNATAPYLEAVSVALGEESRGLMKSHGDRQLWKRYDPPFPLQVERRRARSGSWYEFFPRSCRGDAQHGRFSDCLPRLQYIADLGFDIVYVPPIHPIGTLHRKGPDNSLQGSPADVGSPWAIGSAEGGHKSIHSALGTLEEFRAFRDAAGALGLELALDIAFQCSPDHPYVHAHPSWFRHRADGTIQYAENPPKKYQDIYPFDFESPESPALWQELLSIFQFWLSEGIRIFRVDNPHTKPFAFWEWAISRIKAAHPDVILLSEAFTRPRVMERLAKSGFTLSYTYFTWRNSKHELTKYFEELSEPPLHDYFWPSLWPNTPDILPAPLHHAPPQAFAIRAVLAATLGASYGVYGPAFELCDNQPLQPGSEEYLHSEKYQIRTWDMDAPHSLRHLLAQLNGARRRHPALQTDLDIRFHPVDNEALICYSKGRGSHLILVVVNLDPRNVQSGWVDVQFDKLGFTDSGTYAVYDVLSASGYTWQCGRNFVRLDPATAPAHLFRVHEGTGS